ncbi:hypothetical protein [Streptomyces sp. NPDC058202]|uniref:VMAP-C domain-containing protein n=1 Tax=Streptomyces sp. NPDC058202 TaxID=3346380 RepID=UPI0036E4C876
MSPRRRQDAAPPPEPANTLALVVGVEEYAAGSGWSLDGPALDACRFASWLTGRGVPADQMTLLVSPLPKNAAAVAAAADAVPVSPADSATVRAALTDLRQRTSGLLVVYWGGHGVIEDEERRLFYADATSYNLINLNLTVLLRSLRSSTYSRHPRQLVLVDACALPTRRAEDRLPDERFAEGRPDPWRDQWVLTAASPGEAAANDDARGTGLFSDVLGEELARLPRRWPPDAETLRDAVRDRFEDLRAAGRTQQMPSHLWFRSRGAEHLDLVLGAAPGTAGRASDSELLTHAEFRALRAVLDGAPAPEGLRELFRDATRDVPGCAPPALADDLLSTVRALRGPVSPRPLFHFLVRLAAASDQVTQDRLWEWLNETAPRWGVELAELHELDGLLRRTHIVFRLRPDLLGEGFQVTGWSVEDADVRQEVCTDGEPWDLPRVALELGEVIADYAGDLEAVPPVVEFLLPLALLDQEVEALPVQVSLRSAPIGELCPVVVRPLERLDDGATRDALRMRWKGLAACGDGYARDAIHWVLRDAPQDAADHGPEGRCAPGDAHVCAALAYARPHGPAEDPTLRAVLDAGMPVALWHRAAPERPDRRTALEAVLSGRALRDLPDVVRGQRTAARHPSATPEHAGNGLVLLWDDPDRLPHELRWQPPALSGVTP